ncbi:response regulator receiver and Hpt phospho transfer protein [Solidesulfovibrio fructosivorans JJ]]|uniref:Response regulator receiver and Hpt phospho transfer protein n=1 Tax=Solidesulfovibrio fructosivorans JJ] TaxID=596151 RepID=E1JVS3_SOLFR|nr:response regulator [Solidesulfovibrio fructosivorans]EFL51561.1 response regulator receiver and Hpt phospho transfer protein [Solidesulfovibrio fructosivorans JJ]]
MPSVSAPPRILLVDDNADNLVLMRLFLDSDYRIDEAANGREAVDRFAAATYDLVLMDLEMPVLDGHDATRAIRALESRENRPPTPILVLTAHSLDEQRDRCREAGCSDFLVKPVRKAAILAALRRFLGRDTAAPDTPVSAPDRAAEPAACPLLVDRERLRQLLPLFFDTAAKTLEAARLALDQGDLEAARRQGHKLKGSALSYGFEEIGLAAKDLELAGEAGDAPHAATALDRTARLLQEAGGKLF